MEKKKSFVLYTRSKKYLNKLTNEKAGILLKAIFAYVSGEELPEMDELTDFAFAVIKEHLDEDHEKYMNRVNAGRINGRKGGRPKKVKEEPQEEPQKESPKEEPAERIPYKEIIAKYNEIVAGQPMLSLAKEQISDSRKKHIRARLKDYTIDDLYECFRKARDSDWMSGRSGRNGRKFDIDWMLKPENIVKILEGAYDNNAWQNRGPEPDDGVAARVSELYDNEYI